MILELDLLNSVDSIDINYIVNKDEDLIDKRIHEINDGKVVGRVYNNSLGEIILECNFSGSMLIEDSVTLDLVLYKFNIDINENINIYEDCYEIKKNTLDLKRILWQNIVLEVPISYTEVKDAVLSGDGWELAREDKKVEEIDPRLKKLEDLLKGDD